jgi:thiosulfate/3-mercaptopyruvate sulfurtransferase
MFWFKIFFVSVLFSTALICVENDQKQAALPAIVDVAWLQQHLDDPHLVIVDLRTKELYHKAHIKGAVNLPAKENLFTNNAFMPGLNELKERFSRIGIDHHSHVIAYDEGKFIWAARFYWILEVLGHGEVGILNVGYGNWENGALPISTTPPKSKRKEFVPRIDNTKLETKLGTLLSIGKKTIIDGRKESHYIGKESRAKRFGHIPTAKNYACTQNYQVTETGNKMKSFSELQSLYKDIPKDKPIILYCDGGAEAALNFIVLQELGYKAAVYDGSWLEWGNDSEVPIDTLYQQEKEE